MNIKRFQARTVTRALEMVKAELGEEAVILTTKRRQKKDPQSGKVIRMVEVVAAVDTDLLEEAGKSASAMRELPKKNSEREREGSGLFSQQDIRRELSLLRELLTQTVSQPLWGPTSPADQDSPLLVLHNIFSRLGMEPWLQQILATRFLQEHESNSPVTSKTVISWLGRYGLQQVKTAVHAETAKLPLWWAVIGTTGVGKTTTLAKLAARLRFQRGLKGVLVTTDTYRLGAIEQIKRYSELMDLPLEVATEPQDLVRIFAAHKDKDFILVDTTGRSIKDPRHKMELSRIFDAIPRLRALALLPATAKSEDVRNQVGYYSRFSTVGWALTKVDETQHYGPLFTPVIGQELPVSYITNGQKVPEDIAAATPKLIMRLLLSSRGNSSRPTRQTPGQGAKNPSGKAKIMLLKESI